MDKVVPEQRAKQGSMGRPVLYILIGSFILLGVYMVSLLGWSGTAPSTNPATQSAQDSAKPGASSSNSSGTPAANPAYPAPASPTAR